jgi:small subunit ribosomal protein S9
MKVIHTSGKRKSSVARATLYPAGTGIIRINSLVLDHWNPGMNQLKVREPILLAGEGLKVDVRISVHGGGVSSQAEACRLALARALVEFDKKLEKTFLEYDRQLLVADVRQRESRKPNTHGKARSKRQKSYR